MHRWRPWSWIRVLIFDLISPGPVVPPLLLLLEPAVCEPEDWSALSELSMLVNAEDSADSSDELTVPADTSF